MTDRHTRAYLEAALSYLARQRAARIGEVERVERLLFGAMTPAQRAPAQTSAKKWAAICGRRSGKTVLGRMLCLLAPLKKPDSFAGYVALTRKSAKLQVWPRLLRMVEKYKIPCKPHGGDLTLTYTNGSVLFLGGADSSSDIQKYRGLDTSFVLLDEAAAMPDLVLRELVDEILEPTLLDHDGTLAAISTPGPTLAGYLYDQTANPETVATHVQTHHWTVLDNPHIPHARAWLADLRRRNGWDEMHPTYRREWLGEWVADDEALVYHFDPNANGWDGILPTARRWEYCLGVDVGYSPDPTAFVLVAHAVGHPIAYATHSERHLEWTPTRIAERIRELTHAHNVTRIVADLGGAGGKGLEMEWRQRFSVPLHVPVEKHKKREHIALVDDALRTGRLRIKNGLSLIHELNTIVWDARRQKPSDAYPNDEADALEYAYMAARHYTTDLAVPRVDPEDLDAKWRREEERLESRAARELTGRGRRLRAC